MTSRAWGWCAFVLVGLLATGVGALAVVRSQLVEERAAELLSAWLRRELARPAWVERVRLDARGITLQRVRVPGLLRAEEVRVDWDFAELLQERLAGRTGLQAVREVRVVRPFVLLVRVADGRWNVEALARPARAAPPGTAERPRAAIHVSGGVVQVVDLAAGGLRGWAQDVQATVRLADVSVFRLQASTRVLPGGARVQVFGWVDAQEGVMDLAVRVRGLIVGPWLNRLAADPRWRWESGTVAADLRAYGPLRAVELTGTVKMDRMRGSLASPRWRVQAAGEVQVSGRWLALRSVRVQVGSTAVRVEGEVRLVGEGGVELDVAFRGADPAKLRELLGSTLPMRGALQGQLRVEGPLPALRVRGGLVAPVLVVGSQPVRDLAARVEVRSGTVSVRSATARVRGGRVHGQAVVTLEPPLRLVATAGFEGVDASLFSDLGLPLILRGRVGGLLMLAGPPANPVVAGAVRGGMGEVQGRAVDSWSAAFEYAPGQLRLHAARLEAGELVASAWGELVGGQMRLQVAARSVPLQELSGWSGLKFGASGALDVTGRVEGRTQAPRFSGRVRLGGGSAGPLRWDEALAELDGSWDRLRLVDLRWRDGPDLYRAWGDFDRVASRVRLHVESPGLRLSRLVELLGTSLPASGQVRAQLDVTGSLQDPVASATLEVWDLRAPPLAFSRGRGRFRWEGGVLAIQDAVLRSGALEVRLSGAAFSTGDLQLAFLADRVQLAELAPLQNPYVRLDGEAQVRGQLVGRLHEPIVDAQVHANRLRLNGELFDVATGRVMWSGGVLQLAPLELARRDAAYVLRGRLQVTEDPTADLALDVQHAPVRTLLGVAGLQLDADGRLSGQLTLSGPLSHPRAELDVTLTDGQFRGYRFPSGRGRAVLDGSRVELQDVELAAGRGRLRAQGQADLRGTGEVEVAGLGLDASAVSTVARLRTPLVGSLDFTVQLSGTLQDPVAGLTLEAKEVGTAHAQADRLTVQAIYRDGFLELEQLLLEEDGQRVQARGRIPLRLRGLEADPQSSLDFVASTESAHLGILRLLPFVEAAQGPLEASLRIGGTVADPKLEGFARTQGGRVKLVGLSPAVEGLQAEVRFDHASASLRQFRADLGGGTVEATGEASFEKLQLQRYALQLRAHSARVEIPPYFRGAVDGSAQVTGTLRRAQVAGRLALSSGELVAAPPPAGAGSGSALPVDLDLELAAGQGLFVVAGPVRLQIGGGLHVGGTVAHPALSGTVTGRGGEVRAFGTTFVVEEGTAVFQEFRGTQPLLSARARTRVGDVTVFVHVAGTPGQTQLRLTSDPELPHDRIVQLLAAQAGIERALAGEVEAALRQQLARFVLGEVEQRIRQLLGLAELRIEYDVDKPLRLRLGRFLLQDLYLTLTTVFDSQTRLLWALEYRFRPHYALAVSHDTAGVWMVMLRANFTW